MLKQQDIQIKVQFTEGYEKRFTQACLNQLRLRNKKAIESPETLKKEDNKRTA